MQIFPKTHFDFIGWRWKFFAVSGVLLGGSIISLATKGAKYGIDFTGGTVMQVTFKNPVDIGTVRSAIEKSGFPDPAIQHYSGTNTFSIRIQPQKGESAQSSEDQLNALKTAVPDNPLTIDSKSYIGPAVSQDLFKKAVLAIVFSLLGIIVYLAFRFSNPIWGIAGIIALLHDVLATYGLFSIAGREVDLLIISALLTIGGYSIHDTIVIFDRMREKMGVIRNLPLDQVINESMNETLSRTIITSGIVLAVVLVLFLFGGQVIHDFALALVFGTMVGTYSSIAVAAPLVYEWHVHSSKKRPQAQAAIGGAAKASIKPVAKPKPANNKRGR
ncbi:MAG: protein translocase subunit SecF [Elusimicrobia bacterium]|nr:protein translocase subunit SecF [Elusimicrobiota bacterium]